MRFILVFDNTYHVKAHLSYLSADKHYSTEYIIRKIHWPYYGGDLSYADIVQIHSIHAHSYKSKDVLYSVINLEFNLIIRYIVKALRNGTLNIIKQL